VLKTEEPGSKQVLAFRYDRVESVCFDMINHLINDCVVMGAEPLAVQDLIVCGKLEKSIVTRVVSAVAAACKAQGCALTGGETTEQPDILPARTYILGSSVVGVVERAKIIDGTKIRPGDIVIALGSSGAHTNGYTLIRDLLARNPALAAEPVGSRTFIDAVLEPHRCYYQSIKGLFDHHLVGMAHITGGGIRENLNRILPATVDAKINLAGYRPPPVFKTIRDASGASIDLLLRTFNLGVGLALVCRADLAESVTKHLAAAGELAYVIGEIVPGTGKVDCHGTLSFGA
ncbi:MAG: phosphoribosylformylglycinamidine cyclo-ligase, partial [Deltaproteobacteria bacterium]|nr:phosphoribosylformylglycinamidine cyclo-ligase [Deltaproteobacteria bacterium]